jgi:hypothetical protein
VGGATYLVVPRESYWWLSHYEAFADTLRERFPVIASHEDACILFELGDDGVGAQPARSAEFVGMERA